MRKVTGISIMALSVVLAIYLTGFLGKPVHYMQCQADSAQLGEITAVRQKTEDLLDALIFNEETLFYDGTNNTFYYSLIEGNAGAYNPRIETRGKYAGNADIRLAFSQGEISEDTIRDNKEIYFLAYTEDAYCEYFLKCTTLPMMNITCRSVGRPEEISDEPVSMQAEVFDNRQGAASRLTLSDGIIHVRGGSTRGYLKKGYKLSLTRDSLGNHIRDNDISLLGMRQNDEWVLYAAYNDQEKIRNVFSCNLWKYTCATDNAGKIDTGVEYKYLELFLNGEYWGLYALGYTVDKKQLQLDAGNGREALYKVMQWVDRDAVPATYGNGYETRGMHGHDEDWSALLLEYYGSMLMNADNNENLYAAIDIDNAIDVCLFFNLIQGLDNVKVNLVKNLYVAIRREEDGRLTALYAPWDMDISWGNCWDAEARIFTVPYGVQADANCVMESGHINHLILNGDGKIWQLIFDKYQYLRSGLWSEETINAMLDEYEADIYYSGAFRRDMERWPEGFYTDASRGLDTFREYVMERLKEADAYYARVKQLCRESTYVRRTALYKEFEGSSFIMEINNRELLEDTDYKDLLDYMGISLPRITEDVHFILAKPSEGKYDYLPSLTEDGESRQTSIGTVSFTILREGVYEAVLDGTVCYDVTEFVKPAIRMSVIRDNTVRDFSFAKGYGTGPEQDTLANLKAYVKALSRTGYQAVIEITDTGIWQDPDYAGLFGELGLGEDSISGHTDFIVWDGVEKAVLALDDFHVSGSRSDTPAGALSLFEGEGGIYGIYLNDNELVLESEEEMDDICIRILLLDADTHEIIDSFLQKQ